MRGVIRRPACLFEEKPTGCLMRGVLVDGEQIRIGRLARGLTQEQLAVAADVDVKTIRKAEQGGRLDVGTLSSLSRALGVDLKTVVSDVSAEAEIKRIRMQVVERWIAAWDARDLEALLALHHDDAVMLLPGEPGIPFGGRFAGKQAIRAAHERAWQTLATQPVQPGDYQLVAGDDTVVMHGTKHVECPDGRFEPLSSAHIYRFIGDQIIELRVEYDTLALLGFLQGTGEQPPAR